MLFVSVILRVSMYLYIFCVYELKIWLADHRKRLRSGENKTSSESVCETTNVGVGTSENQHFIEKSPLEVVILTNILHMYMVQSKILFYH